MYDFFGLVLARFILPMLVIGMVVEGLAPVQTNGLKIAEASLGIYLLYVYIHVRISATQDMIKKILDARPGQNS